MARTNIHTEWVPDRRGGGWSKRRLLRLSPGQATVLLAFWQGETVAETAERLKLSPRTVEAYRRQARFAMAAPTTTLAVKTALEFKLLKGVKGRTGCP